MAGGKKCAILCHMNTNKTPAYQDNSSASALDLITLLLCLVLGIMVLGCW